MKEIKKPLLAVPILSSFVALFALIGLVLGVGIATTPFKIRLTMIILGSFLVIVSLIQWPVYLKQYIDYRFQEKEKY